MSVSARERNTPTQVELEDLLGMLLAAVEDGQLVSITFMLKDAAGQTMVDYRGTHELTEIATRVVRDRIANEVEAQHPAIAGKIRESLEKLRPH